MFPAKAVSLVNIRVTIEFCMISCGTNVKKRKRIISKITNLLIIPAARSRTATLLRLHLSCKPLFKKETSGKPLIAS